MRVWMTQQSGILTLQDLDDQRLLAQHREVHGLLSMIAGPKRDRFKNNPLSQVWKDHFRYLIFLHDDSIQEMKHRGWQTGTHNTPISLSRYPFYDEGVWFEPTLEQTQFDRNDLIQRFGRHCESVMAGKRKDTLRWTNRSIPSWVPYVVRAKIATQQTKIRKGGVPYNVLTQ